MKAAALTETRHVDAAAGTQIIINSFWVVLSRSRTYSLRLCTSVSVAVRLTVFMSYEKLQQQQWCTLLLWTLQHTSKAV